MFEEEAAKLPGIRWLAQGTIYPDVIESAGAKTGKAHVIKSHHNVGGLPEKMNLKLLEPLRELFKDEVRKLGVELGLPREMVYRHPFPGPGLGVRILGEVTKQYADLLRKADAIYLEELRKHDLYDRTSQAFAVFLPVRSVAVMGDGRRYDYVIALRAVETIDFMTARWSRLPYEFLELVVPAHHQRSERHLARHLRHLQQAAGDDRVGVIRRYCRPHGYSGRHLHRAHDVSAETLANLGPLSRLAGIWEGHRGVDLNPKADGPEQRSYYERIEMQPIDAQANGPQLFYGLRYHVHINTREEQNTFHDQVGYWLWEPATGLVLQTLAIPRGQIAIAAGHAERSATKLVLKAGSAGRPNMASARPRSWSSPFGPTPTALKWSSTAMVPGATFPTRRCRCEARTHLSCIATGTP